MRRSRSGPTSAPITPRRDGGGRLERRFERDAERVQVPHRVDHRQDAAGEDAVAVAPHDAVAHLDRDVAEAVGAVAGPRACDRVGDEGKAPGCRLPDHAHRVGGEVDAVEDDLDDHVGPGERRAGHARVAVGERAHRVEEVRDGARRRARSRVRLLGARVGVAGRDGDPARDERVDEVERPGQLGCQREEPDGARREETLEQGRVRVAACGGRMRPEPPGREERAFDVRAEDPRAASAFADLAERGDEPLLGRCDQRRQVRGDAGLEQGGAGLLVPGRVGVEEVDAAEAVHLKVDEPGRGDPAAVRRGSP